jgi:hypothetical protein
MKKACDKSVNEPKSDADNCINKGGGISFSLYRRLLESLSDFIEDGGDIEKLSEDIEQNFLNKK